MSSKVFGGLAY